MELWPPPGDRETKTHRYRKRKAHRADLPPQRTFQNLPHVCMVVLRQDQDDLWCQQKGKCRHQLVSRFRERIAVALSTQTTLGSPKPHCPMALYHNSGTRPCFCFGNFLLPFRMTLETSQSWCHSVGIIKLGLRQSQTVARYSARLWSQYPCCD